MLIQARWAPGLRPKGLDIRAGVSLEEYARHGSALVTWYSLTGIIDLLVE